MKLAKLTPAIALAVLFVMNAGSSEATHWKLNNNITADRALTGIPLVMSPDQQPPQFTMLLREDVENSRGTAILLQRGKDVEFTFTWLSLTSPVTSAHFHKSPHGRDSQVGVRASSICGVPKESPPCPSGRSATFSGVWKNADLEAFARGEITAAFHTEVYPAPIGELAVYIPAAKGKY